MRTKKWYRERVKELEEDLKEAEKYRDISMEESDKWFNEWCAESEENSQLMRENSDLEMKILELENEIHCKDEKIVFGRVTLAEHEMLEEEVNRLKNEKFDIEHELFCERIRIETLIDKLKELGYDPEMENEE